MSKARDLIEQLLEYSDEEIKIANATSRSAGSVSAKALVPRYVEANVDKKASILDFGAGKDAVHAKRLKDNGFENIVAYDFGANSKDGLHDPKALSRKYDCVYASNVLNVQSSPQMMQTTLDSIANAVKPGGIFVGNFPESPRKSDKITPEIVYELLTDRFKSVDIVGGGKRAPVYLAKK